MPMKLSKSLPLPKFSKLRILSSMCGECPAGSSRYFFGRDLHVWACALQRPDQEGHPVLTPGSSRQEQQVPPWQTVAVAEMFLLRRMPWPRQDQKPRPRQTPSDLPRQPSNPVRIHLGPCHFVPFHRRRFTIYSTQTFISFDRFLLYDAPSESPRDKTHTPTTHALSGPAVRLSQELQSSILLEFPSLQPFHLNPPNWSIHLQLCAGIEYLSRPWSWSQKSPTWA